MSSSTPQFVCAYCGEIYGRHKPSVGATWHIGDCGVCKEEAVAVTETQDFGGLLPGWEDEYELGQA